jgi:hypothetical protein
MGVERPAAGVLNKRHQLPLRRGREPVDKRHDRLLGGLIEGGSLPLWPAAREPFEGRRGRGGIGIGKLHERPADSLGIPLPRYMFGDPADDREKLRRRQSGIGHEEGRDQRGWSQPGRLRRLPVEERRENTCRLDCRCACGSVGEDRISKRPRILEGADHERRREVERRALGERLENSQADDRRGIVEELGPVDGGDRRRIARQHLDRIHADTGRRVLEGAADGVEVARETTVEEVNSLLRAASEGSLGHVLGYEERPLVSIDYKDDPRSSIIDALSTMVVGGTQVKILAWYDNEWGYANRYAELARLVGLQLPG